MEFHQDTHTHVYIARSYRVHVLTAASIAPCRLVEVDRRFRGEYYLRNEEDRTSETSVYIYGTMCLPWLHNFQLQVLNVIYRTLIS
jgi:hypothetical protein